MDKVVVGGCVLLIAFGAVFGMSVSLESGTSEAIKSALGVLADLATLLAVVVAVYALTLWRHEFRNDRKFDALARLKFAVDSLKVAPRYMRYSMIHGVYAMRRAPESELLNNMVATVSADWKAAQKDFSAAVDECELFVEDSNFRKVVILQMDLFELVMNYKEEMLDLAFREEPINESEIRQHHPEIEARCSEMVDNLVGMVKEIRVSNFR